MIRTSIKVLSGSLALGLGAGALAALAGPAHAATGSTATIKGSTVVKASGDNVPWYDSGSASPTNTGQPRTVTLIANASGPDIEFTLTVSKGPQAGSVASIAAGHRLDAYVRLDGAKNTRGTRFAGQTSPDAAAPSTTTFKDGATIKGTFINAGLGEHTLTLTDILLDTVPGGIGNEPQTFDTFYNAGTDASIVDSPVDWPVAETVTVGTAPVDDKTKPVAKLTKPKKKAAKQGKSWKTIRGTVTDDRAVKDARVKLVSKSSKGWSFFNGKKYKAVKTKKKALKKAKTLVAAPNAKGAWKVKVGKKAPKGRLTVQYWGTDLAGNASKAKKLTQKITK